MPASASAARTARDDRRAVGLGAGAVEIVGLFAAAAQDAENRRRRAPSRFRAIPAPAPPAPSAMTKPSRSLEKGLDAFSGGSFWVDSADSSEKRISASAVTEPSAPMESARVGFAAADRLDAELDGGRARGAGGRQRDRQAARAEACRRGGRRSSRTAMTSEDRRASFWPRAAAQQPVVAPAPSRRAS